MKALLLLTVSLFLIHTSLYAQPTNDDCSGLVDLGVAPFCDGGQVYNNVGATASDIGEGNIPSCFYNDQLSDVWFKFTASDTITNYDISVTGINQDGVNSLINPEIAIYRGEMCATDELGELICATSYSTGNVNEVLIENLELTPGAEYFVRVSSFSTNALSTQGAFFLCVTPLRKPYNITAPGSTACSGELFDSGGPDGNYSPNENNTFTICPDQPSTCINFELLYYRIGPEGTDQIIFYDGPNTSSPVVNQIGISDSDFPPAGGAGVCYNVKARSGCLTIQFESDGEGEFEGFHGKWECSAEPCFEEKPIEVRDNITEEELKSKLARGNMSIEIDTIICKGEQYGVFDRNGSSFPLERGLLITSGRAKNAIGPNDGIEESLQSVGGPSDPDLDSLSDFSADEFIDQVTFDACVVELEVFVPTDELHFDYIFASEEYSEFVNNFNDIFALLISGPGIEGDPKIGGQENIAIVPSTNEPVSINNVNHLKNWQHYVNSETSTLDLQHFNSPIEYDGMTVGFMGQPKYLTAKKKVTPCQTYRLKFAVADQLDDVYDTGVFIADIRAGSPSLSVQYSSGFDFLAEQCTPAPEIITISIPEVSNESQTFDLALSGTATLGSDYLLDLPSTITFAPGQTAFQFPITVLTDEEQEGIENVVIKLIKDYGCGEHALSELVIEIKDQIKVEIDVAQDTLVVCQGEEINLQAIGGDQYSWTSSIIDTMTTSSISFNPLQSAWVYVQGNVGRCADLDSVYVDLRDISLQITDADTLLVCPGGSVKINVSSNPSDLSTSWENTTDLTLINNTQVEVSPSTDQLYTVTLQDANCTLRDSVWVLVSEAPEIPITSSTQTDLFCQGDTIVLSSATPDPAKYPSVSYAWSGATNVISPLDQKEIRVVVGDNQTFTRVTTYGSCTVTHEYTINIAQPYTVSIDDVALICAGETAQLTANASQSNINFSWQDAEGNVISQEATASVQPSTTQTYTLVTEDVAACYTLTNQVTVTVESAFNVNAISVNDANGNMLDITSIAKGQQLILSATVEPQPASAQYQWYMDGELIRTTSSPTTGLFDLADFEGEKDVVFSVVVNANGCMAEQMITAHIIDNPAVYVPTAFTPDQDGRNDRFKLLTSDAGIQISEFRVYNRWGQLVYDNENGIDGWDGTFDGEPAPTGVYAYSVTYVGSGNTQPVKLHGEVTLLR